jgi:hypothetical protein
VDGKEPRKKLDKKVVGKKESLLKKKKNLLIEKKKSIKHRLKF